MLPLIGKKLENRCNLSVEDFLLEEDAIAMQCLWARM